MGGDAGLLTFVGEVGVLRGEEMLVERSGSCISTLVGLSVTVPGRSSLRPLHLASKYATRH